jgi:hypothetical protein
MTRHRYYFFAALFALFLCGCKDDERQQQLDHREERIGQREREFVLKEADYKSLLQMRDSLLAKKDTAIVLHWPDDIAGLWNAKAVCRESNCPEYVIGDQRFNSWEFISDSAGLYTRVMGNDNQLVRVFNARYDSTGIVLNFVSDSSVAKNMVLNVELSRVSQALLRGQQTVNINQACTSKFSLELTRQTTK